jgi:two-component system, response regulator PdtaR
MKDKIKIMIVEDEAIIARDLQNILVNANYDVCGKAESYEAAMKMFCMEQPQIVMCDIYLKGPKTGVDFANEILRSRSVSIIFITAFSSNEIINKVVDMQNISYITKPFTNTQVTAAVKLASYRIKNKLRLPELTRRQEEILILIKDGVIENISIAQKLNISIETVKTHKRILFQKFKVKNTSELLIALVHYGIS